MAALSMAGAATVDAAVKTYWDQATGKWMKYDTNARRVSPLNSDGGNTTSMGKVEAYKGGSSIPRKTVDYDGPFHPGTIVVDTSERRLYYVLPDGKALKYGVGVGREGFQWSGVEVISRKAEWPGWTPPPEMIAREKKKGRILPAYMEGGPTNPLGARAMYIGGTLYRIHGSNEPWTMGQAVSSGCIRMTNDDVSHLYERVKIGTRVVVLRGDESKARLYALANPPPPKKEIQVADARTKDDALVSMGIGLGIAVAGTVPVEAVSVEATASVEPVVPEATPAVAEEVPAPAVVVSLPEARAKDDAFVAVIPVAAVETPPAAEATVAETPAPDVAPAAETQPAIVEVAPAAPVASVAEAPADIAEQPVAAATSALPVDESAKDDDLATAATPVAEAVEPIEQGDAAAPVEADAAVDVAPAADPAAKDDGIATDLGGGTIPIEGPPAVDDKAANNTATDAATVVN
jgi:lipoprotein-anchoring transpeptidase ErfK/SrfK